ncbi:hypothetical protein Tco_0045125 [Tanacetum coccineum]
MRSTVVSATSSEGTHAKPEVPDEDKGITEEKVILEWGDEQDSEISDDDNDNVVIDDKDGDADDEGDDHVSDTQDADDEDVETESDKDEIYKYKIRVRNEEDVEMKDAEVEEPDKGKEKVTDAAKEEAKKTSEAKNDTKKSELPPSSSSLSVSSGFGDQFLKLSFDSSLVSTVKDSVDADVSSLLDIPIQHKTPQTQSPSVQKIPVSVIPKTTNLPPIPEIIIETPVSTAAPSPQVTPINSSVQQTPTPIPTNVLKIVDHSSEALAVLQSQVPTVVDSYLDTKLTKKPTPTAEQEYEKSPSDILKIKKEQAESQKNPQFTIKSIDKAALEDYDLKSALYQSMHGIADIVKDHKRKLDDDEDDDDDADPPAGPNQGKKTKRRRTKESESSKKSSSTKEPPKGKALTKGTKTGKSASAKEPVEESITEVVMDDAGDDVVRDDYQPQDTSEPKIRKTLNPKWFKQPLRPPTPDPEWNKRQPLPLQGPLGHRTVAADYFFNNDLEYLKTSNIEVTYTTSITKTKAARYEIKGIEDMFLTLWSIIKHAVNKFHGHGHLEEIMVKRSNQQLYKFKECDLVDLHLNDIKDMLLLAVQHKLFHLDGNVIVDFIVALQSYQKKLNITKPQKTFPEIEFKEPYTPSYDPPGIVYEDLDKHNRVLRADELYKFSDGTLKSVRDEIHHRVLDFCLDYNPGMLKRKWTAVDRKRSGLMIELIDKQLREREIIRNLERLLGARELEMDYNL